MSAATWEERWRPPPRRPNLLKHPADPKIGGDAFLSDTAPEEKAAATARASPTSTTNVRDGKTR
jgi:hypothetical protein